MQGHLYKRTEFAEGDRFLDMEGRQPFPYPCAKGFHKVFPCKINEGPELNSKSADYIFGKAYIPQALEKGSYSFFAIDVL